MDRVRTTSRLESYKLKVGGRDKLNIAANFEVWVTTTGAQGYANSVVIKTDHDKYLFNCGETTLKCFTQVLNAPHAIDNIFFTYNCWRNVGGLIGMMITMNSSVTRSKPVTIHGPPHVDKVLEMSQHFSQLEALNDKVLSTFKCRGIEEGLYQDRQLSVEYVKLVKQSATQNQSEITQNQSSPNSAQTWTQSVLTQNQSSPNSTETEITSLLTQNQSSPNSAETRTQSVLPQNQLSFNSTETQTQSATVNQTTDSLETTRDQSAGAPNAAVTGNQDAEMLEEKDSEKFAVAYIITPSARPRNFDQVKVKTMNIPRGPWFKQLQNGESVTLADGRVIHPDDVLLPHNESRRTIVVLECPGLEFLDSLAGSEQLAALAGDEQRRPHLVVHMTPSHVLHHSRYKNFMDRYRGDTYHLMLNEECQPAIARKTLLLQSTLHALHPQMFPQLTCSLSQGGPVSSTQGDTIMAELGFMYRLRPENFKGLNWYRPEMESFIDKAKQNVQDFDKELQKLKDVLANQPSKTDDNGDYPEITFLGTGSAEPSVKRNASGILVQLRAGVYMLMDCGEGTLAQLYQLYGAHVSDVLANIRAIFISHLHYDHHGGVFNVVEARQRALKARGRDEPLHLLAPKGYLQWMRVYRQYVQEGTGHMILHTTQGIHSQATEGREMEQLKQLNDLLGTFQILCAPVIHTRHSYCLVLTHGDGWKLVYTGDTRPCHAIVKHGKDCDILIHEASFDDARFTNAVNTKHSTSSEAIDIGESMRAKFILLTHFSQRNMYIPVFSEKFSKKVGFAFDFMRVRRNQLHQIPLLKPVLLRLFSEPISEDVADGDDLGRKKKKKEQKRKKDKRPRLDNMDDFGGWEKYAASKTESDFT